MKIQVVVAQFEFRASRVVRLLGADEDPVPAMKSMLSEVSLGQEVPAAFTVTLMDMETGREHGLSAVIYPVHRDSISPRTESRNF